MRAFLFFVDGFGLGDPHKFNPVFLARTPTLDALLGEKALLRRCDPVCGREAIMMPIDASLGVPGLPQSATGQTSLLTGINAAKAIGRHLNAYPTPALRKMLTEHSIFKKLTDAGKKATFLNAYRDEFFEQGHEKYHLSCTTVAVMGAGLPFRGVRDLLEGNAVYQDIVNRVLLERGYSVPIVEPEEAGRRAARLVRDHDFSMFEFFQTDIVGHARQMGPAMEIVERIDRFLGAMLEGLGLSDTTLVLTSDHGNVEDMRVGTHTNNQVPAVFIGKAAQELCRGVSTILDIAPAVVRYLIKGEGSYTYGTQVVSC